MNFGHGELGFGAWPIAKSIPVAENCTVFSLSTPIAFEASPIAVFASCAEVVETIAEANARPARHFFNMLPPTEVASRSVAAGFSRPVDVRLKADATTYTLPLPRAVGLAESVASIRDCERSVRLCRHFDEVRRAIVSGRRRRPRAWRRRLNRRHGHRRLRFVRRVGDEHARH